MDRVRRLHAGAGQGEIHAELAGRARQKCRPPDIREQPDAAFRHRECRALGHHAVRTVDRNADSAAHDDPVDQRDIGFGELVDGKIEPVFVPEKHVGRVVAGPMGVVERADVAARAERPVAFAGHRDRADRGVVRPFEQLRAKGDAHVAGQGVESRRRVEVHAAQRAGHAEFDEIRHQACVSSRRAMMTRMISLVPSRIW